jgi:uncharacterized protein (TIGR01777 family)
VKIVLPGGSGQVGTLLARRFQKDGHEVVVLSRAPGDAPWRIVAWDAATYGQWAKEIGGADVVVNLAGRNVNCRYTPANRRLIKESRIKSTRVVGEAIARAARPPKVWLQASTATIYAHTFGPAHDENGEIGGKEPGVPETWRFSIDVATSWERALDETNTPRTRKVKLRSAMTMSPDRGGVFDTLLRLVRFGLGGRAGDGRQYVSWIHEEDFVRAIYWLIERQHIDDAVNLSAPEPLPNAEFMRVLREASGIRIGLPAAEWMLEIGARVIRTETELILKSRRVVPGRLLREGFQFQFPDWQGAATELCERWRAEGRGSARRDARFTVRRDA